MNRTHCADAPSDVIRAGPPEWRTSVTSGGDAERDGGERSGETRRSPSRSEFQAGALEVYVQTKHRAALFVILWMFLMFVAGLIYCRVLHGRYHSADNGRANQREHYGH